MRTAAPAVGAVCSQSQSQSLVQRRGLASDHPVWKLGRFNHAAHAVPNLKAASDFYKNMLRARVSEPHVRLGFGSALAFAPLLSHYSLLCALWPLISLYREHSTAVSALE